MLIQKDFYKWTRLGLINLVVVAFLGVLLRYKIAFAFPIVDQKHLLHGHSHFAFTGWISQILMTFFIWIVSNKKQENKFNDYKYLLWSNHIVSYLMLFAFTYQGYGNISIPLSMVSIIIGYLFSIKAWRDINETDLKISGSYFKAAIIFNFISTFGTYWLAYLTAHQVINQKLYLLSVYFYLHFQYNGWFIFSCLGILMYLLAQHQIEIRHKAKIFAIFSYTLIPCFLLSALWIKLPIWMYVIVIVAAIFQLLAWIWLLIEIKISANKKFISFNFQSLLFYLSAIALTIKFLLQALSTIPVLSTFAFGYRPVVIGYLHLIMLGIITMFMLAGLRSVGILSSSGRSKWGIIVFIVGFVLNEFMLLIQALSFLNLVYVSFSNEILFVIAIVMFIGLAIVFVGSKRVYAVPSEAS